MSIRITALYVVVAGLSIYAWKDWFKGLCGLILMMSVISHPDMPKTVLGIQGLNPWNVLFVMIVLAWGANRRRDGLTWDMPRYIAVLLLMYLAVILIGVFRAIFDRSHIQDYPLVNLISEELINTIKWILPGLLLFDGCRTRKRVIMALVCLLVMYLLMSAQVVKYMPSEAVDSSGVMMDARENLSEQVGYSAADISVMVAGACWGMLAALPLVRKKYLKVMVLVGVGVVAFSLALTGGRGGYVAWGATGLVLCLIKWRKYLIFAPIVVMLLPMIFPGSTARMLQGFEKTDVAGQTVTDDAEVTSGRTLIWPYVIEKIGESPLIGYGRLAMKRTGLQHHIGEETEDFGFPHPHNMYLETLLDNGILGSIPIWLFWAAMVVCSATLFRSGNHLCSAVGGLALALTLTSLIAGISGQHYFPQEHTLGIWAACFLSLRVYVKEKQMQMGAVNPGTLWGRQPCRPRGAATFPSA